jgi:hypothetical protein
MVEPSDLSHVEIDGGAGRPTSQVCDFGAYCLAARYRNRLNERSATLAVQRFDFDKDFFGYFLSRKESSYKAHSLQFRVLRAKLAQGLPTSSKRK